MKTQKCVVCGAEKIEFTEALGHSYIEATCIEPKKCSRCSETFGKPLNHKLVMATCYTPIKCTVCGITFGGADDHDFSTGVCACGLSLETVESVLITSLKAISLYTEVSKKILECLQNGNYDDYIGYTYALYVDKGGIFKDAIDACANIPDFAKLKSYMQNATDIMNKEINTRLNSSKYTPSIYIASYILNKDVKARENISLALDEIGNLFEKFDAYL